MYCPKCGVGLSPGASFCNKCGAAIIHTDTPSAPPVTLRRAKLLAERLETTFAPGSKAHKTLRIATISCVALAIVSAGALTCLWIGRLTMPGRIAGAEKRIAQLEIEQESLSGQIAQSEQQISELDAQRKAVEEEMAADARLFELMNRTGESAVTADDEIAKLEQELVQRYSQAQVELMWYLGEYNRGSAGVTADVQSADDVLTDYLLGKIVGSSSVQASIRSVIGGVAGGDSLDDIGRDAVAAEMDELPGEIRDKMIGLFVDATLISNVNKVIGLLQGIPSRPQALINQLSAQSGEYLISISRFLEAEQSLESFKACVDDVERMYSLMQELQKAVPDVDLQVELWKECSWDMGAFFTGYVNTRQMLETLRGEADINAG